MEQTIETNLRRLIQETIENVKYTQRAKILGAFTT
jgi:hypothetical protein